MEVIGKGFGKLILFGEHFVVYGLPGIASGVDNYFQVKIKKIETEEVIIEDDFYYNEIISSKKNPDHIKYKVIKPFLDNFKINGIKIIYGGNIAKKGMGLSGAYAVATIRAVNDLFKLNLDNEKINFWAYECEKVSHGFPSGIDNTCSTYGSLLWFEKNISGGKNKIELFNSKDSLLLVIGNTGIISSTKEIVDGVKKRKEKNEGEFEKIFEDYKKIVNQAKIALENNKIEEIGELMNQNNNLLKKIGVSCKELDELVNIANENGALGAKITGAGKGGIMFALAENEKIQEKIAKAFENAGYTSIKTKING